MARRATAGRFGFTVPGLRAALAQRWRALNARWEGQSFGDWAQSAETGQALTVDGHQIWLALYPVAPRAAAPFEHDDQRYELISGTDQLVMSKPTAGS